MLKFIIFLGFCIVSPVISADCSWENCPAWKSGMLNVHLVSHSHDDAGWLKTVDQYFWGANRTIDPGAVKYTLDTVIHELLANPNRRFSYCEQSYFWRWWIMQREEKRRQVQKLVRDGQLEFINGGWVQNDEAGSHYQAIIDQMTWGMKKLNETFGQCGIPKVGWQIDPFGHSREHASLLSQMGMEALFFARLHYLDFNKRAAAQSLEHIWRGSDDFGANLFTSAMYGGYGPPDGFCWDAYCSDDLIMDDKRLDGYNVDLLLEKFFKFSMEQGKTSITNHILIPMGSDFQYTNAQMWFENIDKLIRYANEKQTMGSKINLLYSTPTCYVKAVNEAGMQFTTKSDDFFPYASDIHQYWTGYFTSRPAFKGFIRMTNSYLQTAKQLDAQFGMEDPKTLEKAKNAMGLTQHHDAVSGTAKQHVTNDYTKRLYGGLMECQQVVNVALDNVLRKTDQAAPWQSFCLRTNETICNVTEKSSKFTVTVFNSMAQIMNDTVRVPVPSSNYDVTGPDGAKVQVQSVMSFTPRSQLPYVMPLAYEIILPVQIPPLGFATYHFSKSMNNPRRKTESISDMYEAYVNNVRSTPPKRRPNRLNQRRTRSAENDVMSISNEMIELDFDSMSGLLTTIKDVHSGNSFPITQNFYWYRAAAGDGSSQEKQASGAYVFRPNGTTAYPMTTSNVRIDRVTGDLVQEIRQTFNSWASQVVRLYKNKPYAEFEWTIGPIPIADGLGKEVISRFDTNIQNAGVFYTDANGRQMMERKRDYQPTYTYNNSEPVSGNYYPVNAHISIKDNNMQIAVLTDRSEGGSSLMDGSIELMMHRRLLVDDGFGVGEPLNETGFDGRGLVVRGKHWLVVSTPDKGHALHRTLAKSMFHQPILSFATVNMAFSQYQSTYTTQFGGLTRPLPANVHLLTLEQWQPSKVLIRLEHIFQTNDDPNWSMPVTIDLQGLFTTFDVLSIEELMLGANQFANTTRWTWRKEEEVDEETDRSVSEEEDDEEEEEIIKVDLNEWISKDSSRSKGSSLTVMLNPFEIKTLRCTVRPKMNF